MPSESATVMAGTSRNPLGHGTGKSVCFEFVKRGWGHDRDGFLPAMPLQEKVGRFDPAGGAVWGGNAEHSVGPVNSKCVVLLGAKAS